MRVTDGDEVLVQKSRRGDQSAFEELVRRTSRLVFARIYLETGDRLLSEDLVQEAYLAAYRSIGRLAEPGGFRAWLMAIARNVVVDDARRRSRQKRRSGRMFGLGRLAEVPDAAPGPSQDAETSEQRRHVLAILRGLPEEYRLPLMLRYIAGASYDTISRQLALSNGSLRGLLQRGMAMMRAEMTRGEPPAGKTP
jgi:RNA polymerase sigma-70 factor (ECF subfamily)